MGAAPLEEITRFTRLLGHDLNSVLSLINNYASLLLDDLGSSDPRRDDVHEIASAGSRAGALAEKLLAFSRDPGSVLDPNRPPPSERQRETILVADDEDGGREIARRILTGEGFNVLTASSGREALAQLEGHSGRVDLVLTDFMMPGMSGAELADRVRELSEETKVLFMSGFSAEATAGARPGAPAHEHLQKPFDAAELVRRVGKLLPAFSREP